MPVREPGWWYGSATAWQAKALSPIARIWSAVAERRISSAKPVRAALPVICIGNFTAGGTGKTPLSIYVARLLVRRVERPIFLTRGYGGRIKGPHRVSPALDTARDVGDEPLLLARHAPVIVSRDRTAGAALAARDAGLKPPSVIVMDDGLQNPGLAKDLSIAVVDSRRGIGNGLVIPAGPLRVALAAQLELADAIVVNRAPGAPAGSAVAEWLRKTFPGPVVEAAVEPDASAIDIAGARVITLAGIANPSRFTALVEGLCGEIVRRFEFADHHTLTEREAAAVLAAAKAAGARIVTTEKDFVRLSGEKGAVGELAASAIAIPIKLTLDEAGSTRLDALIGAALTERRKTAARA